MTLYVSKILTAVNPVTETALTAVNKLSMNATSTPGLCTPGRERRTTEIAIAIK